MAKILIFIYLLTINNCLKFSWKLSNFGHWILAGIHSPSLVFTQNLPMVRRCIISINSTIQRLFPGYCLILLD